MQVIAAAGLLFQTAPRDPVLASRIQQLLHTFLLTDDPGDNARTAAQEIVRTRGLVSVDEVGDDAAYALVLLTCSPEVSILARQAAERNEVPEDAAALCEAHLRQKEVQTEYDKRRPDRPSLRDRIEVLFKADQSVRQRNSDIRAMVKTDARLKAELEAIFAKYGVPTFAMVGPSAASHFVVMVQHQSPEFRRRALPKLKANVDAGQADPASFAMVYDRTQTDSGSKQLYGENFTCDAAHPKLHVGPIEDEEHVDQRRAQLGMFRLALYAEVLNATSPDVCSGVAAAPK
ncbi:MAG: hypothetical protein QOJ99_2168 [Bryobacterales bacterium]|nr:hypothetical protein [Bryobacterales bacterium]